MHKQQLAYSIILRIHACSLKNIKKILIFIKIYNCLKITSIIGIRIICGQYNLTHSFCLTKSWLFIRFVKKIYKNGRGER